MLKEWVKDTRTLKEAQRNQQKQKAIDKYKNHFKTGNNL